MDENENLNANTQAPVDDTNDDDDNDQDSSDTADSPSDDLLKALLLDETITVGPNEIWLLSIGADQIMFNVKVGPNGELPIDQPDHYSARLLDNDVLPERQADGSIYIGFTANLKWPNMPGSIVFSYMDPKQQDKVVAYAVVMFKTVLGLKQPSYRRLTADLLVGLETMDIQHGESYLANVTTGTSSEFVVPTHSGYAVDLDRYRTGLPLGQAQPDDPNTTGDNSIPYFVNSNASTIGVIEEPFEHPAGNAPPIYSPTVVALVPKANLKSKLYGINWPF